MARPRARCAFPRAQFPAGARAAPGASWGPRWNHQPQAPRERGQVEAHAWGPGGYRFPSQLLGRASPTLSYVRGQKGE